MLNSGPRTQSQTTYNSETTFHGIDHQESSRYEKSIVLRDDVFGRSFDVLNKSNRIMVKQKVSSETRVVSGYFFIVGFHADEQEIGGEASKAVLEVGARTESLGVGVDRVDALDDLFEYVRVQLAHQLGGQLGLELDAYAVTVVALHKHFGA